MKQRRINKISMGNLRVAESVQIIGEVYSDGNRFYHVRLARGQMASYLSSGSGPMVYDTPEKARRAIRRVRPDLEPTTI